MQPSISSFLFSVVFVANLCQFALAQSLELVSHSQSTYGFGVYLDKEPQPLNLVEITPQIEYPADAVKGGVEGMVQMMIRVDELGNYVEHQVAWSSHHLLTEAVTPFLKCISFEPAEHDGKFVSGWKVIPFKFRLYDHPNTKDQEPTDVIICPTESVNHALQANNE